jgi:RluA family pseudouridine synthase
MPQDLPAFQSRPRRPPPEPEPIDITVLYQDDSLMVIDKPPAMVVHPTYRNWSGTLLNGLLWRLRGRPDLQPRIMTRLDKDTSGLVLIALRSEMHAQLQRQSTAGHMRKEYVAVVQGTPEPARGSVTLPLGRSPDDRRRVIVTASGQHCHTDYEVMSSEGGHTLVRCELRTGRTHQIRVHLAAIRCPIVGDRVYGEAAPTIARQALHAWRITLTHPATGRRLEISSPLPADLESLLSDLHLSFAPPSGGN